jgi:hypothetical protein
VATICDHCLFFLFYCIVLFAMPFNCSAPFVQNTFFLNTSFSHVNLTSSVYFNTVGCYVARVGDTSKVETNFFIVDKLYFNNLIKEAYIS